MQLLLDTHIYLWWIKNDRQLSKAARSLISSAEKVYISSASIWEIAIKVKLGKLEADLEKVVNGFFEDDFLELPITMQHAMAVSKLPGIHRDPFDRILIAQAMSEPLRFLTVDRLLREYSELVEVI